MNVVTTFEASQSCDFFPVIIIIVIIRALYDNMHSNLVWHTTIYELMHCVLYADKIIKLNWTNKL